MSYEIWIDKEITIGETTYSVYVEADLEYSNSNDPEPSGLEITKAVVVPLDDGNNPPELPLEYEGLRLEKIVVAGNPALTEAIDTALWEAVRRHTEDNYGDITRDLREERYDHCL